MLHGHITITLRIAPRRSALTVTVPCASQKRYFIARRVGIAVVTSLRKSRDAHASAATGALADAATVERHVAPSRAVARN